MKKEKCVKCGKEAHIVYHQTKGKIVWLCATCGVEEYYKIK